MFNQIVSTIPQRFRPEKAADYETVFHFDISGDDGYPFTIIIRHGQCKVSKGLNGHANCVVKTKADIYTNLELGKTNPQMALMMGKVKVSNLSEMMRFAKVFRRFSPEQNLGGDLPKHIPSRKPQQGPLKGIKIIDFTRLLPGPMATMMLADMGAEVIKVEDPSSPDYVREFAPFIGDTAAYYLSVNRSKRSLAVNYNSPEGKQLVYDLAKTADVFIEQFRPGIMEQMGLGYKQLKEVNPKLIYISITGYGQDGPYAQKAGHDLNYIGYGGLLGITGSADNPAIPGGQIADIAGGGYMAVNACMAALLSRHQTGMGQYVDVSMTDCIVPLTAFAVADNAAGNTPVRAELPLSGGLANYNVYKCADGRHVALGALEPKFWQPFCDLVNHPEWKQRIMDTGEQRKALKSEVAALFLGKSQAEWIQLAEGKDICLSPMLDIDQLVADPQLRHRKMIVEQQAADGTIYQSTGIPLKFGGTPAAISWAPPLLGEDSIAILKELNYSDSQIKDLLGKQVVSVAH
jgi:alpha-methylacyl-CoA racemase